MDHLNPLQKLARHIIRAFSRLPLPILYILADIVYILLYKIAHYRVKVVRQNLLTAFPEKTDKERKQIEQQFYKHLSDYFFETIKALTISDDELTRRMKIRNPELIANLLDNNRTVFMYAAHIGNWEWFTNIPILYPDKEIHAFYQKQQNKLANYISLEVRTRRDIAAVEGHRGFRYTYECIRDNLPSVTLVIGDQCPHKGAQKIWMPFCGKDTPFLAGPEHIARKLNVALIYTSFVAYKRGYYEVQFRPIALNPKDLQPGECTRRFATMIEDDLARIPQLWLWSHRRWKLNHKDFPNE